MCREEKTNKRVNDKLSKIPTCVLVKELSKREGVKRFKVSPHTEKTITIYGPTIVLNIID